MAHTERLHWRPSESDPHGPWTLDHDGRDRKGQCWCCSGWKRPARRNERHAAKAALRRDPDRVSSRNAKTYWA